MLDVSVFGGLILGIVAIFLLFVFPIKYLFDYDDGAALGCFGFIFLTVFLVVLFIGWGLEEKKLIPRGDADVFVLKWGPISLACISGLLVLGCIIRVLYDKFSE